MSVQALKKQVQILFNKCAYKSTSLNLQCVATPITKTQQKRLKYKVQIDIAQKIYNYYRNQQFKFSQNGITPQIIATQCAIFGYQNKMINFQIDSFGYFNVTPSQLYLNKMIQAIDTSLDIKNINIFKEKQMKKKKIYYCEIQNFTISELRMLLCLELFYKKDIQFNFQSIRQLEKIIVVNKQQRETIQKLINQNFIKRQYSTFILDKDFQILNPQNYSQVILTCIRHNYIDFVKRNIKLINNNRHKFNVFGQIFPDIKILSLDKQQIAELINICNHIQYHHPLNLYKHNQINYKPPNSIPQQIKLFPQIQQILYLLDQLSDNKVHEVRRYLSNINKQSKYLYILKQKVQKLYNNINNHHFNSN